MKLKDTDHWDAAVAANQDLYGGAVVTYSKQWADLMEQEMAAGKKLEDIAKSTSHEANTQGITEFQYSCAVSILSRVWVHGEALRCWHNLKCQIKDEGEKANESGSVLNTAILTIDAND